VPLELRILCSQLWFATSLTNLIGGVVQQGHETSALHMFGDYTLVTRTVAGVAARQNLAAIADETLQLRSALVIYSQRIVAAELALFGFSRFKRPRRP
jgi:hypothetical protein